MDSSGYPNEQHVSWVSSDGNIERAIGVMKSMRFFVITPVTENTARFACQFTSLVIQVSDLHVLNSMWNNH
jgi:hypothetical protein